MQNTVRIQSNVGHRENNPRLAFRLPARVRQRTRITPSMGNGRVYALGKSCSKALVSSMADRERCTVASTMAGRFSLSK